MELIAENQYFGPISYYSVLSNASHIIFEQCEWYQKRSFRNRCVIVGANGIINLSIPLDQGRDQKRFIRDVRIANQYAWQDQHWKTIVSCYNSSPFFEFYKPGLEEFYKSQYTFLFDWNLDLFNWVIGKFKWDIMASFSTSYKTDYEVPLVDMRDRIKPSNYTQFEMPAYNQVFINQLGFKPNLSILDLLFCKGPGSAQYLRNIT